MLCLQRSIVVRNLSVLLIILNLLYFYIPVPPIIWRLLFVVVAMAASFSKGNKRTTFENILIVFLCLNLFHFFLSYLWLEPTTTQIGNIMFGLFAFPLFAYLGRSGVLTSKFFTISAILIAGASVANYQNALQLALNSIDNLKEEQFTNNASVLFLYLLPSLIYIKKDVVKYLLLVICLFFLITSLKRGNILAAIIPITLIIVDSLKKGKSSHWKTLFIAIIIIGAFLAAKEWILNNNFLWSRFEDMIDGNSSNRDVIYANAWSLWYNADHIWTMIFGYGFDGTITHITNNLRAHNDWLEILVDYGVLGVIMYVGIFTNLYKISRYNKSMESRMVIYSAIVIWFMKSCYSMGFTDEYIALLAIPVGAAIAKRNLKFK